MGTTFSFAPEGLPIWHLTSADWFTLNTDSVVTFSGHNSVGDLLRDAEGSWIARFSRAIGVTNALQADHWTIHDRLIFIWSLGINRLQLQADSLAVVNLLKDPLVASSSYSLVRAIAALFHRAWKVGISWIPRGVDMSGVTLEQGHASLIDSIG
ncbi:hypothetical protein V6N13_135968 [Hibiscus sabdariffa]|uniref:RNase H type-1 domain-containing protein n=2 Tax=Hibiscus sabdariffa TaxID=183260 RepID=A0ABR2QTS8_9ROSI